MSAQEIKVCPKLWVVSISDPGGARTCHLNVISETARTALSLAENFLSWPPVYDIKEASEPGRKFQGRLVLTATLCVRSGGQHPFVCKLEVREALALVDGGVFCEPEAE